MAIIRVKKRNNPYVIIDKTGINDKRLSWKARGLLCYLLSKPDDWQIYLSQLIKVGIDKRSAVEKGINELMKYGYIDRKEKEKVKGQFKGYDYNVYEIPMLKNNIGKSNRCRLSAAEKPYTDNRQLLINEYILINEFTKQLKNDFNNEVFINKYKEFINMRKNIKKPIKTIIAINRQIHFLHQYNLDEAIQILDKSIMNEWQGLFELKKENKQFESKDNMIRRVYKKYGTKKSKTCAIDNTSI